VSDPVPGPNPAPPSPTRASADAGVGPAPPVRVEVWSDVACPWCLLGNAHLREAMRQTGIPAEVTLRSFQLSPDLAHSRPVKEYLAQRFGDPARVAQSHARLAEMGAKVGLAYDFDKAMAANTFDAHRLHHLATSRGRGGEVMERLLRAQHTEGRDIASHATLRAIGVAAGLQADEVDGLLASTDLADEVEADIAEARTLGVTGVPFFVFDRRFALSGAQPVETFAQALAQAQRDARRPIASA
jgi:predicted DsbA family dithiol-disulfide isomerase